MLDGCCSCCGRDCVLCALLGVLDLLPVLSEGVFLATLLLVSAKKFNVLHRVRGDVMDECMEIYITVKMR